MGFTELITFYYFITYTRHYVRKDEVAVYTCFRTTRYVMSFKIDTPFREAFITLQLVHVNRELPELKNTYTSNNLDRACTICLVHVLTYYVLLFAFAYGCV